MPYRQQQNNLTCRHYIWQGNIKIWEVYFIIWQVDIIVRKEDFLVLMSTCQIIVSTCQKIMLTCQIMMSTCQIKTSTCQILNWQVDQLLMSSIVWQLDNPRKKWKLNIGLCCLNHFVQYIFQCFLRYM